MWLPVKRTEGCATHLVDSPYAATYHREGKCASLSYEDQIALAAGLGFAGFILLLIIIIIGTRYYRKRRNAARIANESAARIRDEKRSSISSLSSFLRLQQPTGWWRWSRISGNTKSNEYAPPQPSPNPSDESFSAGSDHSRFYLPTIPHIPRLSADGHLLPPPAVRAPHRPPPLNIDRYTPLPSRRPLPSPPSPISPALPVTPTSPRPTPTFPRIQRANSGDSADSVYSESDVSAPLMPRSASPEDYYTPREEFRVLRDEYFKDEDESPKKTWRG